MNPDPILTPWIARLGDSTLISNTDWPYSPHHAEPSELAIDHESGIRWSTDASGLPHREKIAYQYNSHGLIGPELHDAPDTVTLGCSMTNGIGVPHDFTWPQIVAHLTGEKVNNIAEHGQSASQQTFSLFGHNAKLAPPKKIHFLVPALDRLYFLTSERQSTTIHYNPSDRTYTNPSSGKPYVYQSIDGQTSLLPIDLAIHQNLLAVEQLILYCRAHNIELNINSWSKPALESLVMLYPELNILGHSEYWVQDGSPKHIEDSRQCKCGLRPQNQYQESFWSMGKDAAPHPGLHMQIHWAELFLGVEIRNTDIKHIEPFWCGTNIENQID